MIRHLTLLSVLALQGWLTPMMLGAEFPYEAVVRAEEVVVLSGPGQKFQKTGMLERDDHVMVHRHDPGGWFMIAPPQGSFSWIDARHVQPESAERGVVSPRLDPQGRPERVLVRIGSQFSNEALFYGRELHEGDTVEILGDGEVADARGSVRMLKITPPAREYRWVKGDGLVPANQRLQAEHNADPYADPLVGNNGQIDISPAAGTEDSDLSEVIHADGESRWGGFDSVADLPAEKSPKTRNAAAGSPSPAKAKSRETNAVDDEFVADLRAVDREYSEMIALDPSQWKLADVQAAYQNLARRAPEEFQRQVELRLKALGSRLDVHEKYQDFVQMTSATDARDQALVAQQIGGAVVPAVDATTDGALTPPDNAALSANQLDSGTNAPPVELGQPGPWPATLQLSQGGQPANNGAASAPTAAGAGPVAQLSGAGIVQRVPSPLPGLPTHMLLAKDGRLLTYLQVPAGVHLDLDPAIGQTVGLVGLRQFDPRLRADVITVRQLQPVRLK